MSAFTLIYTRAAVVYPSADVNIPYPNAVVNGASTSFSPYLLIDVNVDFLESGIKVGDTVFNSSNFTYAIVTAVTANELTLSDDIFTDIESYTIYQGVNNGCYIYVHPQAGEFIIQVETIGGDNINLFSPPAGVLPIQVKKVIETTDLSHNLIALW